LVSNGKTAALLPAAERCVGSHGRGVARDSGEFVIASEGFVFGWGGLHSGCGGGLTSHDSSPRRSRAVDSGERLVTGESGRGVQETAASSVCFFFPLVFFFVNPGDRWAHSIVVHWIAFNSAVGGGMRVFACRTSYFVFSFNTNLFPVCANKYVQSFQKKSESVKTSDSGEVH
jgi:hypothetical protein